MRYTLKVPVTVQVTTITFFTSTTATGGDIERAAYIQAESTGRHVGAMATMVDPNTLRKSGIPFRTQQMWTADAHFILGQPIRDEIIDRMALGELPSQRPALDADRDQIVGWLEQQQDSTEYLEMINVGYPATDVYRAFLSDQNIEVN